MTYPYGRSKFELENFLVMITYSDSSLKSTNTNYFYFFKIRPRTCSKMKKTVKTKGKSNLPSTLAVFAKFECVLQGILKK